MNAQSIAECMAKAASLARHRAPLLARVGAILRYADARIAARQPRCHQSGRCCRFETFGHNLFISTAELAYFLAGTHTTPLTDPPSGTCPYLDQSPARCRARSHRPLGCRMFFCDPAAQWWQQDLYNHLHARLRRAHEQFAVPYYYTEWLTALRAASDSP